LLKFSLTKTGTAYPANFPTNQTNLVQNAYDFLYFPDFNKSFTLYNATGQCTKSQPAYPYGYPTNAKFFDYCVCCGDYAPDAQLKCPDNPWAGPGKFQEFWGFILLFLEPTVPGNILVLNCPNR
jgi:hypothetical protein